MTVTFITHKESQILKLPCVSVANMHTLLKYKVCIS